MVGEGRGGGGWGGQRDLLDQLSGACLCFSAIIPSPPVNFINDSEKGYRLRRMSIHGMDFIHVPNDLKPHGVGVKAAVIG